MFHLIQSSNSITIWKSLLFSSHTLRHWGHSDEQMLPVLIGLSVCEEAKPLYQLHLYSLLHRKMNIRRTSSTELRSISKLMCAPSQPHFSQFHLTERSVHTLVWIYCHFLKPWCGSHALPTFLKVTWAPLSHLLPLSLLPAIIPFLSPSCFFPLDNKEPPISKNNISQATISTIFPLPYI